MRQTATYAEYVEACWEIEQPESIGKALDIPSTGSQGLDLPSPPRDLITELPCFEVKFLLPFVAPDALAPSQALTISLRLLRKNLCKKDLIRNLGFKFARNLSTREAKGSGSP